MFLQKNDKGINKLTAMSKLTVSILTIIAFVAGAVIYMDSTYMHSVDAKEQFVDKRCVDKMEMELTGSLKDFRKEQQYDIMDNLRRHQNSLELHLKKFPEDESVKKDLERLEKEMDRIRQKLDKMIDNG